MEAARAGEAGLGFAVVAEEVRSLAKRSAEAANETASKIESAISRTSQGVEISTKVAATLDDIVARTRKVDELTGQVANAFQEQSHGIDQLNGAVSELDKVTQGNAAKAEEISTSATDLNLQADAMKASAAELLKVVDGNQSADSGRSTNRSQTRSVAARPVAPRKARAQLR